MERVNYEYREGEPLDSTVDSFDFIEAVTTLACASNEISYVAMAKGYVGGLYIETTTTPYKALFNPSTSSNRLWSLIQLSRRVDKSLKATYDPTSNKQRGMVVHGNRFLMHCMFRVLGIKFELNKSAEIADVDVAAAAKKVIEGVTDIVVKHYDDAYPAPLFKNVKKCTDILGKAGF